MKREVIWTWAAEVDAQEALANPGCLFARRIVLAQHVGELGIDAEVGGFLHGGEIGDGA